MDGFYQTEKSLREWWFELAYNVTRIEDDLSRDEVNLMENIFLELKRRGCLWSDELELGYLLSREV